MRKYISPEIEIEAFETRVDVITDSWNSHDNEQRDDVIKSFDSLQ